jgi:hypothetical protein
MGSEVIRNYYYLQIWDAQYTILCLNTGWHKGRGERHELRVEKDLSWFSFYKGKKDQGIKIKRPVIYA